MWESWETFSSFIDDSHGQCQQAKELEDQSANGLQLLSCNVTSKYLDWKEEV